MMTGWMTNLRKKMTAICHKLKQWFHDFEQWLDEAENRNRNLQEQHRVNPREVAALLYQMVLLPTFFAVLVIWVGTDLLSMIVDFGLYTASKHYTLPTNYTHGAAKQISRLTAKPLEKCLRRTRHIGWTLGIFRFIVELLLSKLTASNLNLCIRSTGPSRDTDCSVCWTELAPQEVTVVHPPCGNSFHASCIDVVAASEQAQRGWVSCPFCRQPMNEEANAIRTIRSLPSGVSWQDWRLNNLSKRLCQLNACLTVIALAVSLAKTYSGEETAAYPTRLLLLPPALLTAAVISSASAIALEQVCLLRQSRNGWPNMMRIWVNVTCMLALTVAGRQTEMPKDLTFERLMSVGLRRGYTHIPGLATENWWQWLGKWYSPYLDYVSAALVAILAVVSRALIFTYD